MITPELTGIATCGCAAIVAGLPICGICGTPAAAAAAATLAATPGTLATPGRQAYGFWT